MRKFTSELCSFRVFRLLLIYCRTFIPEYFPPTSDLVPQQTPGEDTAEIEINVSENNPS